MESKINLSKINLRSQDAWGPDSSFVFEQYRNLPFAPFNKLEKLGRFCDISNPMNKPAPTTSAIASAVTLEEEAAFVPVEVKMAAKKDHKRPPVRKAPVQNQPTIRQPMTVAQSKLYKMPTKQPNRNYNPRTQVTKTKFKETTLVQPSWQFILDANKTNFDKTPVNNVKITELGTVGSVPIYDKLWDGKPKKIVPFTLPNTVSFTGGPRSDRFMLEQIKKDQDTDELTVYTTDLLLSVLLTSKNSNFPWDILAVKEGNQIFLEPASAKNLNYIDILSVNENTAGSLPEDEKELLKACIESTNTNRKFIEITTKPDQSKDFTTIKGAEAPERKAYRYRKFNLDNKVNLVVRSEIDAYVKEGEGTSFVKVCALNEYQPQQDWKQNYELNKGAVISSELRNNLNKICRWLCQALLADCGSVRLGFVTKQNVKDGKHYVLTVEDMTTNSLSNTINYRLKDSWSVVKTLTDILAKQEDGTYAFIKQAYKPGIRVYRAPDEEAEESDDE